MHGGGGAPAEVNDRQWQNQIGLYEPDEGIYVAPAGPDRHVEPLASGAHRQACSTG
jgi:hypothetical protein